MATLTYDDLTWQQQYEGRVAGISDAQVLSYAQNIEDDRVATAAKTEQAAIEAAKPPTYITSGDEYDRWRLHKGDQTLGDAPTLTSSYETANIEKAYYKETFSGTQAQYDTLQRYNVEMERALDKGKDQEPIFAKYGIDPSTGQASHLQFQDKNVNQLYGYQPKTQTQIEGEYAQKFGDVGGFAEGSELDSAYDRVYGEVQEAPSMGEGWKGLYEQYKTWDRQDDLWYQEAQQLQGLEGGAKADMRARMAAGGMKTGSKQWQKNIGRIDKMRVDLGAERAEKSEALKGTSVYQALENEYKSMYRDPELRVKGESVTKYKDALVKEGFMAPAYTSSVQKYNSETGTVYFEDKYNEAHWVDPVYTQEAYQSYEETPTETGKMLYGSEEDSTAAPSFEGFFSQNFGEFDTSGITSGFDIGQDITETEDERRAREASGGAAF